MYHFLLIIHSYWRWLVLISLLFSIIKALLSYKKNNEYTHLDALLRKVTVSLFHIQLILGFVIYFLSPIVSLFFNNMSEGIHLREVRFFAMEHSLMMFVSIVIVTIGAVKVKHKNTSKQKHKATLIWFIIALFIILLNIPWEFSPLVNRPSFR